MNLTNKQTKKRKKRKTNFLYDFVKVTGAIPALIWMRAKIIRVGESKPKKVKGGVLITSNHVSFVDPVLLHCALWYRRLHFLATKDLFDTKLKDFFFRHMNCIMVDKENFSVDSFHDVCSDLKANKAVVIFPEGQVNRTNEEMLSFKSGAVLMAYKSNKPILPICLIKTQKWYHRHVVLVGDPIDVRSICGDRPSLEDFKKASDYLREREMELMNYYHKGVRK